MVRMEGHSGSAKQSKYYSEPEGVVQSKTFNEICMTVESRRGTDIVYLHEFWSYLSSTLTGDDILANFQVGVWVGLMVDHFEKPELGVPLLAVFVGDAEWLPQMHQLAERNNSQWQRLTMTDADEGTDGREKTMDTSRCSTIDGVYVRPRVSYLALTRHEHGCPSVVQNSISFQAC